MTTIKDIARKANVSTAVVSYVINNGPRAVAPQTEARVREAMKVLDYHPNARAQQFARQRSDCIGLIFNGLSAFYVLMIWQKFDSTAPGLQVVERHIWIPSIGAEYLVGVDGLSLLLILLVSLVFPFAFARAASSFLFRLGGVAGFAAVSCARRAFSST